MKLVFLDLDGVLNSQAWYDRRGPRETFPSPLAYNIDPACLARLNRLCAVTGARIVFSSSWRGNAPLWGLQGDFTRVGCTAWFVGQTPQLPQHSRGDEITRWLATHYLYDPFVILDDDADMGEWLPRLVQTDRAVGLTDADVDRAIALLTKE